MKSSVANKFSETFYIKHKILIKDRKKYIEFFLRFSLGSVTKIY